MNRLERRTLELRARGERALAPYLTALDGGADVTLALLRALDRPRVACVELGLPFSDPIADGPKLQAAAERALAGGANLERVLDVVSTFRAHSELPIALMSYANPLFAPGLERTLSAIAAAGVDAVLVADLPVEEGAEFAAIATRLGLCMVFFVAPTTSDERLARAVAASRGFVYAIGRFGVTGAGSAFGDDAQRFLARVRAAAADKVSVAVGFGLADEHGVRAALRHADLAIVGTALVERARQAVVENPKAPALAAAAAAGAFMQELERGLPDR